jgi:hypothetical protein
MFRPRQKEKTKQFCFETSWIKHPEYHKKVQEIWEKEVTAKNAVEMWYIKLNRVKKFLKGWGINIKGQNKRYKEILQKELGEIEKMEEVTLTAQILERKTSIQTELLKILEEEELYWHKRSNLNWLLKGDNNK